MGKQRVRMRRLNWDALYYDDLLSGVGFQITEPSEVTLDGSKKKALYGPQSPLYGTTYEDEQSFAERYRCKCGSFKSKLFEHEICPFCNEPVELRDSDVNVTGWISLGTNYIINPYYYKIIDKIFGKVGGKSVFKDIIYAKYRVNKDGIRVKPKKDDFEKPTSPFMGIGIDEFLNRFETIMDYYKVVKKGKAKEIESLKKQKRFIFTSHIPVCSTLLRPQSVTSDTFYFGTMDKLINTIFTLSESIKTCTDIEKDFISQRIQKKVNKMWDTTFELLNGKDGFIRGELLGGSINYSARNVIIPDPTLRDNEIDISYQTFLEMFKFKIMYYLMKLNDWTLSQAYDVWKKAYEFDPVVYGVMQYILEHEKPRAIINRNPTLNYYSILLMMIREIKPDGSDYTLSVPLSILPGLNADFDGDILNIIGMMSKEMTYMFRKFDPITRMIIDRDSGTLNSYFMVTKGQLIDLYYFCTINPSECDRPEVDDPENETPMTDIEVTGYGKERWNVK